MRKKKTSEVLHVTENRPARGFVSTREKITRGSLSNDHRPLQRVHFANSNDSFDGDRQPPPTTGLGPPPLLSSSLLSSSLSSSSSCSSSSGRQGHASSNGLNGFPQGGHEIEKDKHHQQLGSSPHPVSSSGHQRPSPPSAGERRKSSSSSLSAVLRPLHPEQEEEQQGRIEHEEEALHEGENKQDKFFRRESLVCRHPSYRLREGDEARNTRTTRQASEEEEGSDLALRYFSDEEFLNSLFLPERSLKTGHQSFIEEKNSSRLSSSSKQASLLRPSPVDSHRSRPHRLHPSQEPPPSSSVASPRRQSGLPRSSSSSSCPGSSVRVSGPFARTSSSSVTSQPTSSSCLVSSSLDPTGDRNGFLPARGPPPSLLMKSPDSEPLSSASSSSSSAQHVSFRVSPPRRRRERERASEKDEDPFEISSCFPPSPAEGVELAELSSSGRGGRGVKSLLPLPSSSLHCHEGKLDRSKEDVIVASRKPLHEQGESRDSHVSQSVQEEEEDGRSLLKTRRLFQCAVCERLLESRKPKKTAEKNEALSQREIRKKKSDHVDDADVDGPQLAVPKAVEEKKGEGEKGGEREGEKVGQLCGRCCGVRVGELLKQILRQREVIEKLRKRLQEELEEEQERKEEEVGCEGDDDKDGADVLNGLDGDSSEEDRRRGWKCEEREDRKRRKERRLLHSRHRDDCPCLSPACLAGRKREEVRLSCLVAGEGRKECNTDRREEVNEERQEEGRGVAVAVLVAGVEDLGHVADTRRDRLQPSDQPSHSLLAENNEERTKKKNSQLVSSSVSSLASSSSFPPTACPLKFSPLLPAFSGVQTLGSREESPPAGGGVRKKEVGENSWLGEGKEKGGVKEENLLTTEVSSSPRSRNGEDVLLLERSSHTKDGDEMKTKKSEDVFESLEGQGQSSLRREKDIASRRSSFFSAYSKATTNSSRRSSHCSASSDRRESFLLYEGEVMDNTSGRGEKEKKPPSIIDTPPHPSSTAGEEEEEAKAEEEISSRGRIRSPSSASSLPHDHSGKARDEEEDSRQRKQLLCSPFTYYQHFLVKSDRCYETISRFNAAVQSSAHPHSSNHFFSATPRDGGGADISTGEEAREKKDFPTDRSKGGDETQQPLLFDVVSRESVSGGRAKQKINQDADRGEKKKRHERREGHFQSHGEKVEGKFVSLPGYSTSLSPLGSSSSPCVPCEHSPSSRATKGRERGDVSSSSGVSAEDEEEVGRLRVASVPAVSFSADSARSKCSSMERAGNDNGDLSLCGCAVEDQVVPTRPFSYYKERKKSHYEEHPETCMMLSATRTGRETAILKGKEEPAKGEESCCALLLSSSGGLYRGLLPITHQQILRSTSFLLPLSCVFAHDSFASLQSEEVLFLPLDFALSATAMLIRMSTPDLSAFPPYIEREVVR